jgi:pimeloyl-ACP methyl ester carboxylesterase
VKYVFGADSFFSGVFSDELKARFDIVAMDPRGIGDSTPVHCGVPVLTPDVMVFPKTAQEFQHLREHSRAIGLSCLRDSGALAAHVDTISVARDHEALRKALGVDKISWLAISYGAQVAANYAALFPRSTRGMVIDAALEHSGSEVMMTAEEISVSEDAFNRFAAWCPTSPTCALRGQDVAEVYDRLVAGADAHPIPVAGAVRPVNGEDIRMGTPRLLTLKEPSIYGPDASWAGLSRAIAAAVAGDASGFAIPVEEDLSGIAAIGCMDYNLDVHTYGEMQQRLLLGRELAPHLQGASELWQVINCVDWPIPPANPLRRLDVENVPTLIVNATHDPSTAYRWAYGLAAQIHGSVMLTRNGDGHTSYYTSACARAAIDAYLVTRTAPATQVCDN